MVLWIKVNREETAAQEAIALLGFSSPDSTTKACNVVLLLTTLPDKKMKFTGGLPTGQLYSCMALAEELKVKTTHILYDENKLRTNKLLLHPGHSKTPGLMHTGEVGTLLAADADQISGAATVALMSHEACCATATSVEFARNNSRHDTLERMQGQAGGKCPAQAEKRGRDDCNSRQVNSGGKYIIALSQYVHA